VGKLEWLQGSVAVEREGYSGPAAVGDPVYLLDKWQTEDDSGAELVFVDESRIRMGPKASLEITEYLYQPQEKSRDSLISMVAGKARVLVQDLQDYKQKRFRVQTQTAVVGTRGTEFIVWIISPTVTRVLGITNDIEFCNARLPGACVTVAPHMTSETHANVAPTPPSVAPPQVYQEIIRGVEPAPQPSPPVQAPADPVKTIQAPPPPDVVPPAITQNYDPTASVTTGK
jgi:hypothetical protein